MRVAKESSTTTTQACSVTDRDALLNRTRLIQAQYSNIADTLLSPSFEDVKTEEQDPTLQQERLRYHSERAGLGTADPASNDDLEGHGVSRNMAATDALREQILGKKKAKEIKERETRQRDAAAGATKQQGTNREGQNAGIRAAVASGEDDEDESEEEGRANMIKSKKVRGASKKTTADTKAGVEDLKVSKSKRDSSYLDELLRDRSLSKKKKGR